MLERTHKIYAGIAGLLLSTLSLSAAAELSALNDDELESINGQGLAEVVELFDPTQDLRFMRIRTGARIELSANIDRLTLGEYYRNDQFVAQYCPTPGDFTCSVNDRLTGSAVPGGGNGEPPDRSYADIFPDAATTTRGPKVIRAGFPGAGGNFEIPAPNADLIIENVSAGSIVGGNIQPLLIENPFFEFVFDNTSGSLVGLRLGQEVQTGNFGNASTNGACRQLVTACGGALSVSGNLAVDVTPNSGAAITAPHSIVDGVARANRTPLSGPLGGLIGGIGNLIGLNAPNSTQLIGDFNHQNTQEFFIAINTREITYAGVAPSFQGNNTLNPNDPSAALTSLGPAEIRRGHSIPGFAINLTDGVSASAFAATATGAPKISNCFNGSLGPC